MRAFDSDFKRYLRSAKLAEALTSQEEQDFNYLMNTDEEFKRTYLQLAEKFTPAKLDVLSKYKSQDEWDNITSQFERKPLLVQLAQYKVATSVIVLAIAGLTVWMLTRSGNKPVTAKAEMIQPGIELKLANGETVDLATTKGSIPAGTAVINNTGQALTYALNGAKSIGTNRITVATGMDYKVVLADGSQVWLNSTSTIDFPFTFSETTREVTINGEAYLQIAKNSTKPFIVHLPHCSVKVLGTEFNVNSYDSGIVKVSLVNGAVRFDGRKEKIILHPGSQAVSDPAKDYSQPFDSFKTLSWRNGLHYFEETSLSEIIKVIPRWYNVKSIVMDNSRNQNKRFVGVLNKKQPLQHFLENLKMVSDINSYFDNEGVLHFK